MRAMIVACCVGVSAAVSLAVPVRADVIDRVLAIVNGDVITQTDAQAAVTFGLVTPGSSVSDPLRATLDQIINRELILLEVTRYAPPDVDPALVNQRMQAIRARFASEAEYQAAMARTAMTEERLRDKIGADIRIADYMQQRFGVGPEPGDQEIADYYAAHRAEFAGGGQQLTLEQARPRVKQQIMDQRRAQAIEDWIGRLRRRAEVTDLYFANVAPRSR